MRKVFAVSFVLALALAMALPTIGGDTEAKEVELTGWITDEWCGAKNANAAGAGCARACAKKGSAMALYSEGQLYRLSNKGLALGHLGYKVTVKGTLAEENVLNVTSIEKAEEEA